MDFIDYSELESRLLTLEERYLPSLSPTAQYTPVQEDDMRALRVLAHAEIEFFLERLCELLTNDLERECQSRRAASGSVNSIFLTWAESAAKKSRTAFNSNNGVKDTDLHNMFGPLGFDDEIFDQVDPLFLNKMKQFGKRRGDTAHKSALRVTHQITAQGESQMLTEIKCYLRDFCALVHRRRLLGFF